MITKKKIASTKAKPKRPPDPNGFFKRSAARAEEIVAMYELTDGPDGRDSLIANLVHDLMHLCDRDPELGDMEEECERGFAWYEKNVKENMWIVGKLTNEEAFGRKQPAK